MGTKQFNDKTTHRQKVKTGFAQKWKIEIQDFYRTIPGFYHFSRTQFLPNFV